MKAVNLLVYLGVPWFVQAADVTFKNQCEYPINVYDNHVHCTLSAGSRESPVYGCNKTFSSSTMYRHQENPQATLTEFSTDSSKAWYDINIIPTGSPADCMSLGECKKVINTTGFNVPVMILPTVHLNAEGYRCHQIMCQYDGCEDAYQFPKDDIKVHDCPLDESFQVIYCP
ncbi:hypothetical protein Poli38472_011275 [Pythium oligandrum]|uniref:Secreted protein n=1 Tax=Pythium oligandrum TaxID=41045 RepID=A0A8K1CRZ6_PYTOL|nr:hypothetical protein Poli38472_011275 [Pythium oligandrum]|eukprot:TMW67655.1 hypothetical protein Poli38472_011275 [Pythium oligandrum]